jgi:fructose-bisphosphate aldolase, class II
MITLDEIKKNCADARRAVQRAREQKFALGAFNIDNQETLVSIVRAIKKHGAPALVEITDGEVKAMGLANVRDMVTNYKRDFGVELYINLDHSPTVEEAKAGIDAGFEFIHIDLSTGNHDATDEEIIAATKEVVEYARKTGAIVESEAHYFGGSSNLHKEAIDYDIQYTRGGKGFCRRHWCRHLRSSYRQSARQIPSSKSFGPRSAAQDPRKCRLQYITAWWLGHTRALL